MTAYHRALDPADIALIEKVKYTPTLYDCSSPDFKFAYRKEQYWHNIAAALGYSVSDTKRRWTCLRDRYTRELKQMRLHPENLEYGNSSFFRQMDFLRNFVRKRSERRRGISAKYAKYITRLHLNNWEESNSANGKMLSSTDIMQADETTYTDTQNDFDTKLEVSTTEDEETYPEFVEVESQLNGYEDYEEHEQQEHFESPASKLNKFAVNEEAKSNQNSSTMNNGHTSSAAGAIPITFLNHTPPGVAVGITSKKFNRVKCKPPTYMLKKQPQQQEHQQHTSDSIKSYATMTETEDDFFCKTIRSYLHQLSRRHKIKAKVEMFQILEKYIDIEENSDQHHDEGKG